MKWNDMLKYARDMRAKHPELKDQIADFVAMAQDEIQDGGSEDNECELAYNDIKNLVKE